MKKDANGRTIRVGDVVRVVGIPELKGMHPAALAECRPVFEYLVGKYKRIDAFDSRGNAELWFRMKERKGWVIHWVAIEPHHLRKRQSR